MPTSISPHEIAIDLAEMYQKSADLNEATTRHRIIDSVLNEVLSWPRSVITCEAYISEGYADYVLSGQNGRDLLFIEAKREGTYFQLPSSYEKSNSQFAKIKTLLTNDEIKAAVEQVRNYCISTGCEFAAVTNGHQWIFFKTFEKQKRWEDLRAFVINGLQYFSEDFVDAISKLGYRSIIEEASLPRLFAPERALQMDVYYAKTKIAAYNQDVTSNHLASKLRPLAERFLGRMDEHDSEFMAKCYINKREYKDSMSGVNQVITDVLSPYFKGFNVLEFFNNITGGAFGSRIASNLRERRTREVIILFGGKGSGKSTFIRKLLYHKPPNPIKHFAVVAIVDLLEAPIDKKRIEEIMWNTLLNEVDADNVLQSDRESLLKLFEDKFKVAKNQDLAGLDPNSETYNIELNKLVKEWKNDKEYCAVRLGDYWKKKQKGFIIVLDNTDQFKPDLQDYCFTLAQHISTLLDCLVVISMREERFYYSKLHGTLDAFQNSGFHLTSPPSEKVFIKRLVYILNILDDADRARNISPDLSDEGVEHIKQFLRLLITEFKRSGSHLSQFLKACAHGNMRLSLDLFRQFLLSGYTQVDEIIKGRSWNFQVHQVLRPMMVPSRFFYEESLSSIPNIYQIRSKISGSHFTSLRILSLLSEHMEPTNPAYIPISELKSYFVSNFQMLDDMELNLNILLQTGIVESDNRIDEYAESISSLKITHYGFYFLDSLCFMFNYVDLISLDCAIHQESVALSMANLAEKDISLFNRGEKLERVMVRLERVDDFIKYLQSEEERERLSYSLIIGDSEFSYKLRSKFNEEKVKILKGAKKNYAVAKQ